MKYGYYDIGKSIPTIENFQSGAHILVVRNPMDYINTAIFLENSGWEVRDCIKVFVDGESRQVGLLRKPFKGTVANNVLTNGCGGLNIGVSRIGGEKMTYRTTSYRDAKSGEFSSQNHKNYTTGEKSVEGRFPANIIFDKGAGDILDAQAPKVGNMYNGKRNKEIKKGGTGNVWTRPHKEGEAAGFFDGLGGASRFFFNFNSQEELKEYLTNLIKV